MAAFGKETRGGIGRNPPRAAHIGVRHAVRTDVDPVRYAHHLADGAAAHQFAQLAVVGMIPEHVTDEHLHLCPAGRFADLAAPFDGFRNGLLQQDMPTMGNRRHRLVEMEVVRRSDDDAIYLQISSKEVFRIPETNRFGQAETGGHRLPADIVRFNHGHQGDFLRMCLDILEVFSSPVSQSYRRKSNHLFSLS